MIRSIFLSFLLLVPAGVVQAQQSNQLVEVLQQLTRLEAEVRSLRGEVERLSYENKRLKNQQNDLYVDIDQRLRAKESSSPANQLTVETITPSMSTSMPAAPGQAAPMAPVSQPPVATGVAPSPGLAPAPVTGQIPAGSPAMASVAPAMPVDPVKEQADYKAAFNLLKVGKYDEAIVSYTDFLRKYPSGEYASNAQYWLGEANYVTRQFPVAIQEFKKVINRYPQSRKLPDAMLKIGYIHYELKQSEDARRVLTELTQKFPGTTAARLAENRLQRMKLEGR